MSNRYLFVVFHWLTIVLLSALIVTMAVGSKNEVTGNGHYDEVFGLSLVFGAVLTFPFMLISLVFIPIILRRCAERNNRMFFTIGYSVICCLLGFALIRVMGIWGNREGYDGRFFIPVSLSYLLATVISSVYWSIQYRPKGTSPQAIPDVLDAG